MSRDAVGRIVQFRGSDENYFCPATLLAEHHLAAVKKRYEPEMPARDPSIHVRPWPMPSLALRAPIFQPSRP